MPSEVPLRNLGEADLGSPNFQMGQQTGHNGLYPADNTRLVPVSIPGAYLAHTSPKNNLGPQYQ